MPIESQKYPSLSDAQSMPGLTAANLFNEALGGILKNTYAPAEAEADIQNKAMEHMTPLDQAYMFYSRSRDRLGDDHPTTKAAWDNYQTQLQQQKALTGFHLMQAQTDPFKSLTPEYKNAVAGTMLSNQQPLPGLQGITQQSGVPIQMNANEPQPTAAQYPNQQRSNSLGQLLGGGGGGGGLLGGILQRILGGGSQQQPQQQMQPQQQQPQMQQGGMPVLPQTPTQQNRLGNLFQGTQPTITSQQLPQVAQAANTVRPGSAAGGGVAEQQQDLWNKTYAPGAVEAQKEAGKTGVEDYSKQLASAENLATDATQMKNFVKQFKSFYDKATFTGPILGSTPSTGILPGLAAKASGTDLTNEQMLDNAAQNMQQMVIKLMNTNRLTNFELNFARNLKVNREMTPGTVNMLSDFIANKSDRLVEQQAFLNAAKNKGIDVNTANTLWQSYDNQRPVYDFDNKKVNTQNLNTSKDYLSKEAINAAQQGMPYNPDDSKTQQQSQQQSNLPSQQTKAAIQKLTGQGAQQATQGMVKIAAPDGKVWNIPANKLDEAIKRGARRI